MSEITRRSFLAGAGVAAMAVATPVFADEPAEIAWDLETEVLCLGAGAGGTAAAIAASEMGVSALIIEIGDKPGGSMARCGGGMQAAETDIQKELGIEDTIDDYYEWVKLCVGEFCPDDIIRTYVEKSRETVNWINNLNKEYVGEDLFIAELTNDYTGGLNNYGTDFSALGTTPPPRSHWATIHPEEWDYFDTMVGLPSGGPQLYNPFYQYVVNNDNVEYVFNTEFTRFICDADGTVIGVKAIQDGAEISIKAKKAVVCSLGGIVNSPEMQSKFCPDFLGHTCLINQNNTGAGLRAMMALGADLAQMTYGYPIAIDYTFAYDPAFQDTFSMWLENPDNPNEMVVPGPYLAAAHGGVVINTASEVQNVWGESIPRLFASGCDVGSNVFGKPGFYPGCGTYVTFSTTFGRIAGQNAAALDDWDA